MYISCLVESFLLNLPVLISAHISVPTIMSAPVLNSVHLAGNQDLINTVICIYCGGGFCVCVLFFFVVFFCCCIIHLFLPTIVGKYIIVDQN